LSEDISARPQQGQTDATSSSQSRSEAIDVPSAESARELIADGERAERLGVLDRAVASFTAAARTEDDEIAAEALTRLGDALRSCAEWEKALDAARAAQQIARGPGRELLLGHAIIAEGNVYMSRGDFCEAKTLFERVPEITADFRIRALALQNIGAILAQQGQLGAAERAFLESYGYFQRAGYRRGEATALNNYGRVALDRGDVALAETVLEQAVAAAREVQHGELTALARLNLAEAKCRRGELAPAHELASSSLGFFTSSGNHLRAVECLRLIGVVDEESGDYDGAAACFERALELAQSVGAALETRTLGDCVERLRRRRSSMT
jgi:tetratricopeptide (TPR) repeat protein